MVMLADLHAATLRMVVRLEDELKAEQVKEQAAIDEAVSTHLAIGPHYWEKRHMVEQRLRVARSFLSVTE